MPAKGDQKNWTSVIRRGRATVVYERDALSHLEAAGFAWLAARGVREMGRLLGLRLAVRSRLRFELHGDSRISTARGRTISISAYRVRARTAPYLHEIAHVLLPCRHAPAWFSEGLACYLESAVSESGGGYDSRLFTAGGNRGVDDDARRWLTDRRGRKVLPFIGTRGVPRGIVHDRHNVAAPFYVLSHSLVKFLVERVGVGEVMRLARARRFAAEVQRATRKAVSGWREEWLRAMRAERQ
jgi:hypothetical protein